MLLLSKFEMLWYICLINMVLRVYFMFLFCFYYVFLSKLLSYWLNDGCVFFVYMVEVEMMKEWFVKLLFGEDMLGGVKGVFIVFVILNVIINFLGESCYEFFY